MDRSAIVRFIDIVRRQPAVNDRTLNRDKVSMQAFWKSVEIEMGIPRMKAHHWKSKWRNLKDTFVRKRRELERGLTVPGSRRPEEWPFYNHMSFLIGQPAPAQPERVQPYPVADSSLCEAPEGIELVEEDKESKAGSSDSGADLEGFQFKLEPVEESPYLCEESATTEDNEAATRHEPNISLLGHHNLQPWSAVRSPSSSSEMFLLSFANRLDALPPHVRSIVKIQIAQIFHNAESPHLPPVPLTPVQHAIVISGD